MFQKKGNFKRGLYRPRVTKKYSGVKLPEYRSSWELKFFEWCDSNPYVREWSAESLVVPYVSPIDNKVHKYYVDITLTLKEKRGLVKYVVEIKPYKQTQPPVASRTKKQQTFLHEQATYEVNKAKWAAAQKWANNNDYKFMIITERELFAGKK